MIIQALQDFSKSCFLDTFVLMVPMNITESVVNVPVCGAAMLYSLYVSTCVQLATVHV